MRIGLIGCGRVGTTICYLLRKNNTIVGAYDKNKMNEKKTIKVLRIKDNPSYKELIDQSEALLIATPDDVIVDAYRQAHKYLKGQKYIYHFSGILPADSIPKTRNVYRASVHPFATFPEMTVPSGKQRFFLSIEGDIQAVRAARRIFPRSNFTLKKIRKKDKTMYHLIGVFSSNLLVGLTASIHELAQRIDWHEKELGQMVYPIMKQTLINIERLGAAGALSGPVHRGDIRVIRKHIQSLRKDRDLLQIYKALSRLLADRMGDGKRKRILKRLLH
jgi:predicted short-subunit dehydrogenase-like oxidoreductase (DUF2520 family)